MKAQVRVAAVQMDAVWLNPEENATRVAAFVDKAAGETGAELVVLPELVSSGYIAYGRDREFRRRYLAAAIKVPGPFTEVVSAAAKRNNCYVQVGALLEHPRVTATMLNSVVLFSPTGEIIGRYDKTHIPLDEKHYFYPGESLKVFDTELGRIAPLICADNNFPEAARLLALRGAEILTVSYCRLSAPTVYESIVVARAFENQFFVVTANRVGRQESPGQVLTWDGRNCIVDARGVVLARGGDEEGFVTATLEADTLAQRARESPDSATAGRTCTLTSSTSAGMRTAVDGRLSSRTMRAALVAVEEKPKEVEVP